MNASHHVRDWRLARTATVGEMARGSVQRSRLRGSRGWFLVARSAPLVLLAIPILNNAASVKRTTDKRISPAPHIDLDI